MLWQKSDIQDITSYYDYWNNHYDDDEYQQEPDRMRGADAKRREKNQVNHKWGKDRAKREEKSRELHRDKKGGGNDRNKTTKELD